MKFLAGVVTAIALVVLAGLAVLYTGAFDVAASSGHGPAMRWLLHTAMRQSVMARAQGDADPAAPSAQRVADGAHEFQEHCAGCHGAPGVPRHGMAQAMTPEPPELQDAAREWNAAQLRWIVEHGVKMSGMPAWGGVLKPEELDGVVAFVRALPNLSAADYKRMTAARESGEKSGKKGSGESGDHAGS